jgi:hypothetical protein
VIDLLPATLIEGGGGGKRKRTGRGRKGEILAPPLRMTHGVGQVVVDG